MTIPLRPEHRQQLATLLAYCREMGGVDFYRSVQDTRNQNLTAAVIEPDRTAPQPDSIVLSKTFINNSSNAFSNPVAPEPFSTMPRKPNLPPPPSLMNFSSPALAPQDRATALHDIQQEIGDCTRCPLAFEGRHRIVFGDGDPSAELLFVGEGPGADEDLQGLPFVGRAGQLLNNMITAMSLSRERVYIANIVKCRPPKNRVPEPAEATTCMQFLFQQIGVVRPKLIVALGATAATYLLGSKASLSILRGKLHDCMGAKLIVTYHPAYLLRDPRQKAEAWKDLQLAMKFLHLAPPTRTGS